MSFAISDLDLDFNNVNNELPCELFDVINDTINETSVVCPEYVIGNHFTSNSQMSLADFGFFFTFRNGKTLQSDIENYMSNFKMSIDSFSKQYLSTQRMFIKPEYFKSLNRNFLCNIDYSIHNPSFKTYKGFFLLGCDGSDEKLPDFPQIREEFNIHNTPRYTKPCMGKFSSIQDVLNGFLLDGILGNYKEGELPLIQENLSNVENMICPEKSIFIFDRNYNAMELYARIIEMNSYFLVRLKNDFYKKERNKIRTNDSPIQLELTSDRLKKFHNSDLKEKYSKMWTIDLRIVTITLKNGKTETLLTNLPQEIMTIDDLEYIYSKRWGIETNYNTLKNRFYIENYSTAEDFIKCIEYDYENCALSNNDVIASYDVPFGHVDIHGWNLEQYRVYKLATGDYKVSVTAGNRSTGGSRDFFITPDCFKAKTYDEFLDRYQKIVPGSSFGLYKSDLLPDKKLKKFFGY